MRLIKILLWQGLCVAGACDRDGGGVLYEGPRPPEMAWSYQLSASWSRQGIIAYLDRGFVVDGSGLVRVDSRIAGLWVLNPETSSKERIFPGGFGLNDPQWSPDGSRLAFGAGGAIFSIEADGGGLVQLTSYGNSRDPTWSADGREMVYVAGASLMVMESDGTNARSLGVPVVVGGAEMPAWSPLGMWIAHVRWVRESGKWQQDIFLIDSGGRSLQRLTNDRRFESDPAYSPDGEEIAVGIVDEGGGAHQIWVMKSDGTQGRQLTDGGGPTWSPDGKWLAYTGPGPAGFPRGEVIWMIHVSTGERRQLTSPWSSETR